MIGIDADVRHARDVPDGCLAAAGAAEAIPLRAESCELVLALDVIEHLDDDAAGLRECTRALRRGGLLVVTVPALPSLWGAQDVVSQHRRRYTRATLRDAFARAALSPARVTYFNSLLFPPIAAVRWARRLWPPREGILIMRLSAWRTFAALSILVIAVVAWVVTRASARDALRVAAAAPGVVASAGVDDLGQGAVEASDAARDGVDPAEASWAAELTREVRRRLAIPERDPVHVRWEPRDSRGALSVIVGPAEPASAP